MKPCGPLAVAQVASPLVSERLTPDVVAKVARLARLELTPEELDAATHHLGDMLDHFAEIDALDLSDVEPMNQAHPQVNVLRDDVEAPCLDRDEVLSAAPHVEDGRFRVPPIVGLEG